MKLLIVDDDKTTVDRLHLDIDWAQFGIDTVYDAYSAAQAKTVLQAGPVDMVLCDIEMPGETGLGLLRWMRAQQLAVPLIFLTNHAEFPYAQQAIQLGCADYVCKSASLDEIVLALHRCVDALRVRQKEDELKRMGRRFAERTDSFLNDLLYDLLISALPSNRESIARRADDLHLPVQAETLYRAVAFVFSRHQPPFIDFEPGEAELAVENILSEILFGAVSNPYVVTVRADDRIFCYALMPADRKGLAAAGDAAVQSFRSVFSAAPTVYLCADAVALADLKPYHDLLVQYDLDNVVQRGGVLTIQALPHPKPAQEDNERDVLEVSVLFKLMATGNQQEVLLRLRKYLQKNMGSQADHAFLARFRDDFVQVVYVGMAELGMHAHDVFTPEMLAAERKSLDSLQDMLEWMDLVIVRISESIDKRRANESLTHKMREYIENHYTEKLNRTVVAAAVHVSPDHAAKLFKKEFGMSITDYVTALRLDKAKSLLAGTDLPIGRISETVGFESLTYFSTVFKATAGCSPVQYRQGQQPDHATATGDG